MSKYDTALAQKLKRARELKGSRELLLVSLINGGIHTSLKSLCRWEWGESKPHKDMDIRVNVALDKIINHVKISSNGNE